jgi:hypothetical protein
MFREAATKSPAASNQLHTDNSAANPAGFVRRENFTYEERSTATAVSHAGSEPRFLSEGEVATYLGISTARLVGLRKFDLAMIEKGFKPHGPPPLWQGEICSYSSENLDEWMSKQSTTYRKERLHGHREWRLR